LYNNEETMWKGSIGARLGMVYACWNGNPSRGGCGAVFWSRPGLLKALCKYSGLELFPQDELSCELEISSWAIDGRFQDIIPRAADGGVSWIDNPNSDAVAGLTAGSGFQDYTIKDITNKRLAVFYDCCPTSPFAEIVYNVVFSRSTQYYLYKLIIPSVMLTCVSFLTFWMDPVIGERLAFGITTILAMYANEITAVDMMPVCDEKVLMDYMSIVAMLFGVVSLLETGVVLFLYNQTVQTWGEVFMPAWLRPIYDKIYLSIQTKQAADRRARDGTSLADQPSSAERSTSMGSDGSAKEKLVLKDTQNHHARRNLYRQAFFVIDTNYSGTLSLKEMDLFGKFMLGQKWNVQAALDFLNKFDTSKDGALDFDEFVAFCEMCLTDGDDNIDHIERMVTGYLAFRDRQDAATVQMWKARALKVDYFARWTIPLGFFLSLARLFNITMGEFKEMNENSDLQMIQYFYGIFPLCFALGIALVIYGVVLFMNRSKAAEKLANQSNVCLEIQERGKAADKVSEKAGLSDIARGC